MEPLRYLIIFVSISFASAFWPLGNPSSIPTFTNNEPRQIQEQPGVISTAQTLIDWLWSNNPDLVQKFLENGFIKTQAESMENGTTLSSYRYYSVQDYFYLLDFIKYLKIRLGTIPTDNPTEADELKRNELAAIANTTEETKDFRNTVLEKDLNITSEAIDKSKREEAELAYSSWLLHNGTELGWYGMHIMVVPCVWGYTAIAAKLNQSTTTRTDTIFYKTFIEANIDRREAQELSDFLEGSLQQYDSPENRQIWNSTFRQAMEFEVRLFESAIGK